MEKRKSSNVLAIVATVIIVVVCILMMVCLCFAIGKAPQAQPEVSALPLPEITGGIRGEQFGIDKNINEETIDNYLERTDTVYRDMRMLKDPANYEAIDGDSYLSGFVKGFEIVPYPFLINVEGLPEAVGDSYSGETLFSKTEDGKIVANYRESMAILEYLFPKDKNIILMCGGGGYAGMTKDLLLKLGWDKDKIYNAGAYWSYKGNNNIAVKRELDNGEVVYDFWKIPYHEIDFKTLHKVEKNED